MSRRAYGPPDEVLQVREIAVPASGDNDVLVRVRAASVHPDVWHVVDRVPYVMRLLGNGVTTPDIPGAGNGSGRRGRAVGRNVTRFKLGDDVFGESTLWAGRTAARSPSTRPSRRSSWPKPANVTFEQAAAVPTSGYIALNNLRGDRRARRAGAC